MPLECFKEMNKKELYSKIFLVCPNAVIWHDENGQIIVDSGINIKDLEIPKSNLHSQPYRVSKNSRAAIRSGIPKLYGGKVRKL